jgi:hypothetical protein
MSKLDSIKERTTTLHVSLPKDNLPGATTEQVHSDETKLTTQVSKPTISDTLVKQETTKNNEEMTCPSGMVYNSQGECVKILPLYEIIQASSLSVSNNKANLVNNQIMFNESDENIVYAEFVEEFSSFYMKVNNGYLKLTDTSTKDNMSFDVVSKENATLFDASNINDDANEKYKTRQELDVYAFKPESYTGYCTTITTHAMKCNKVATEKVPISLYVAVYTYFKKVT